MSREPGGVITIVAALVLVSGKALLVRKRGTRAFMQPGGKVHADESPEQTLDRELREELGCGLIRGSQRLLGRYEGPAANEPQALLCADLYVVELDGEAAPLAEIEDMLWLDLDAPASVELAPFTEHFVLPRARSLAAPGLDSCAHPLPSL